MLGENGSVNTMDFVASSGMDERVGHLLMIDIFFWIKKILPIIK